MLTVISGTNRAGSITRQLTGHVLEVYRDLSRATRLIDLAEMPHDALRPDHYGDEDERKPAEFKPFASAMREATALVVISPEYNGGIAGALKLFLDMLPGRDHVLVGRAVCFIGVSAGDWGGLRPVEQLETIFLYRKAYLFPERVLVRHCDAAFDTSGQLQDAAIARRLRGQAERFARFADQVLPLRSLFDAAGNPASLEHPETEV